MLKVLLIILIVIVAIIALLFTIYFFNLDMKLMVNVVAPKLNKVYDKRKRKQYV